MHVESFFTNYQEVGGLKVPGKIAQRRMAMETFVAILTTVPNAVSVPYNATQFPTFGAADAIKAVVGYYPITDFPHWYAGTRSGFSPRLIFALGRWQMRVESGADTEEEFQTMLRLASPILMAEYIRAPVLLVHGAKDTLLPLEESQRMAESLKASGGTVEVLVVPDGGRLFNFRDPQQATQAWQATVGWLDRYLHPAPRAGG